MASDLCMTFDWLKLTCWLWDMECSRRLLLSSASSNLARSSIKIYSVFYRFPLFWWQKACISYNYIKRTSSFSIYFDVSMYSKKEVKVYFESFRVHECTYYDWSVQMSHTKSIFLIGFMVCLGELFSVQIC